MAEAKHRTIIDTIAKIVWLRCLLGDMGVLLIAFNPMNCDNQSDIQIVHNPEFHERTK